MHVVDCAVGVPVITNYGGASKLPATHQGSLASSLSRSPDSNCVRSRRGNIIYHRGGGFFRGVMQRFFSNFYTLSSCRADIWTTLSHPRMNFGPPSNCFYTMVWLVSDIVQWGMRGIHPPPMLLDNYREKLSKLPFYYSIIGVRARSLIV